MDSRIHILGAAILGLFAMVTGVTGLHAGKQCESIEAFQYVRLSGSAFVKETEIHLRRSAEGIDVTSVTHRGEQKLTITSRFDSGNRLRSAKVTIQRDKREQSASVSVTDGTARVYRDGKATKALRCPRGVIVTSAPDWTDSFMALQRYDPEGDKTQKFPGLWIHPTREPLNLTITLTHLGSDSVRLRNKTWILDRYLLVLRGGSRYVVWRNQQRQLVRLVPEKNAAGGILLAGWEHATRHLKPRLSRD